jgi:hypothetical protein
VDGGGHRVPPPGALTRRAHRVRPSRWRASRYPGSPAACGRDEGRRVRRPCFGYPPPEPGSSPTPGPRPSPAWSRRSSTTPSAGTSVFPPTAGRTADHDSGSHRRHREGRRGQPIGRSTRSRAGKHDSASNPYERLNRTELLVEHRSDVLVSVLAERSRIHRTTGREIPQGRRSGGAKPRVSRRRTCRGSAAPCRRLRTPPGRQTIWNQRRRRPLRCACIRRHIRPRRRCPRAKRRHSSDELSENRKFFHLLHGPHYLLLEPSDGRSNR